MSKYGLIWDIYKYTDKEWEKILKIINDWFCNKTNHLFDDFIKQTIEEQIATIIDISDRNEDSVSHGLLPNIRMAVNEKLSELHWEGKHKEIKKIWGTDDDYAVLNNQVVKTKHYKMII